MHSDNGKSHLSHYFKIVRILFILLPVFPYAVECGYVNVIEGSVIIKSINPNIMVGPTVVGREIHHGDLIRTGKYGKIQFSLKDENIQISMKQEAELQIYLKNKNFYIQLNHGNIHTKNLGLGGKVNILTENSVITQADGEMWIFRDYAGSDKIYVIQGEVLIKNVTGSEESIRLGEMLISLDDGIDPPKIITKNMLPPELYQKLEVNQLEAKRGSPFSVLTLLTKDPDYVEIDTEEVKKRQFHIALQSGLYSIHDAQYIRIALLPMYYGNQIQFGYAFEGFVGLADTATNLNDFSVLSRVLAPISFNYKSKQNFFQFNLGKIHNLTFGYGMLLKRYTNTVNYPVKQDAGFIINFMSDDQNYTLDLFHSSLGKMDGGLMGLHATAQAIPMVPLWIGLGYVTDMNQFAVLSDSIWNNVEPRKRSVSGFQIDFTYQLKSDFRNNTYLFGEFTALSFEKNLRYIRNETVGKDTLDQGYERKSAFGILGPGLWFKFGHHRDLKIAINYTSSLFSAPFFSETYELERLHYVPESELDSIKKNNPEWIADSLWFNMITTNLIADDSSAYYLPKDIQALLDPTRNVYNKIGLTTEYSYHYRNYYSYTLDFNIFTETGTVSEANTFYSAGINVNIHDGFIKGISQFEIYYNQYFSDKLFSITKYQENVLLGIRLGFNITHNISLHYYRHDVFYDHEPDGITDSNSTQGFELVARF